MLLQFWYDVVGRHVARRQIADDWVYVLFQAVAVDRRVVAARTSELSDRNFSASTLNVDRRVGPGFNLCRRVGAILNGMAQLFCLAPRVVQRGGIRRPIFSVLNLRLPPSLAAYRKK